MSSTTTTNAYLKSDYLQPSLSSYDSSQSPLALLAQTCSSIGKDCPSSPSSISNSAPPIITSLVTKSSSNILSSNTDKSFSSTKRSSLSQLNNINTNKKCPIPLKPNPISTSSSFIEPYLSSNHLPPLFDPTTTAAAFLLRSSLAYLSSQQNQQHSYSTSCTIPGCFQCETVRHILSASINNQPYVCHCNLRFRSNEELIEHIRHNHRSSKQSNHHRFHPYLKPSMMMNNNDQLPFFYPHLSLSPMTETTRHMNNHTTNKN